MKKYLMFPYIAILLGLSLMGTGKTAYAQNGSPQMAQWVDSLPVPPVATETYKPLLSLVADYYEIDMKASQHQFNSGLGMADVWTYGQPGKDPVLLGPTIVAKKDRPVVIKWINKLPNDCEQFPLKDAIDTTIPGAPGTGMDRVPCGAAIPHLHGGHSAARFDGTPMQWWTKDGQKGMDYQTDTFIYANDQPASLIWYHDHTMGATRFKPYLGLAAGYLIFDDIDNGNTITVNVPDKNKKGKLVKLVQKVPSGYGKYHLPLVIQDKQFKADGTLFYPTEGVSPLHPQWMPEFFGDTPVINGKAYPKLDAEPRRYRLRLLNGSQARFYNLSFKDGTKSLTFYVIGSEGGLLPAPVEKTEQLIAPGERFDVIVDFSKAVEKTVMMTNNAGAPYPDGDPANAMTDLMQINIGTLIGVDDTVEPASLILPAIPRLVPTKSLAPRDVVAKENTTSGFDGTDVPKEMLLNGYHFMDPTTDIIKNGTTETWQWINLTVDAHPMHIHLVTFQVLDRQQFNVEAYKSAWADYLNSGRTTLKPILDGFLIGNPIAPEAEEMGYKDTVKSPPGYVTRIRAKFDLPYTSLLDFDWKTGSLGDWVYHCHILEHEENDMMRPFKVVK
jgi:spore coat protein A, manganese oxidase